MTKKDEDKSVPKKVGEAIEDTVDKIKETVDKVSDRVKEKALTDTKERTPIRKE